MVDCHAIEVVVTRLNVGPDSAHAAAALLSEEERRRAIRFALPHNRRRFIVARARLRQLIGARLGVHPESVELTYGERGKPALARAFADSRLRFNVSHCDDIAVYAFAAGREIGVDVETLRVVPGSDLVAAHMFSRRESEAYRVLDPRDKPRGFFNCWTRKEAFIKALGDGLHHRLGSFDVSLAPGEPARILRVDDTPGDRCGWTLHSFVPGPGLIGAVVVQRMAHAPVSTKDPERVVVRPLPRSEVAETAYEHVCA